MLLLLKLVVLVRLVTVREASAQRRRVLLAHYPWLGLGFGGDAKGNRNQVDPEPTLDAQMVRVPTSILISGDALGGFSLFWGAHGGSCSILLGNRTSDQLIPSRLARGASCGD